MESYFVITCSEDGDIAVVTKSASELVHDLEEEARDSGRMTEFFRAAPEEHDPMYWHGKRLIIHGRVVVPSPRDVALTFDLVE